MMDLAVDAQSFFAKTKKGQETPDTKDIFLGILEDVSKPYISFLTKPLPQRASFVEQIGQVFDKTVYSKSDIVNSLTYAFSGAAYKLPGIDKVQMFDIYGDPVEKLPGEDRMAFLKSFTSTISERPWVKFINERSITFAPTQNRETAWQDDADPLGISYRDYTPEQFGYFTQQAGKYFKLALTGGTDPEDGEPIEGIMNADPAILKEADNTIVYYGQKKMTATEAEVRKALSSARSRARYDVMLKYTTSGDGPMSEGIGF